MKTVKIAAIAAMDQDRVIGCNNVIPWYFPEDFKHFKRLTLGHTVLMGRKTYQSLPDKVRPLPGRLNVVLSAAQRHLEVSEEVYLVNSYQQFFEDLEQGKLELPTKQIWIIGGATVYRETVDLWGELYLTLVHSKHCGDAWFPLFEHDFDLKESEDHGEFSFLHYVRRG